MESVTFYAWVGDNLPSDEVIRISGGQRTQDAKGMIMASSHKEARFSMGKMVTDDPETINVIRGMIKKGASYTEDIEVYYSHVLSDSKKVDRSAKQAERVTLENKSLREQLEAQARKNKELEAQIAEKNQSGKQKEKVPA